MHGRGDHYEALTPAERENVEVIRRGYDAFARGDVPGLLALMAEDIEIDQRGALPPNEQYFGHAGTLKWLGDLAALWEDMAIQPLDYHGGHRSLVIVNAQFSARQRSTGEMVEASASHIFHLADGKISLLRIYQDRGTVDASG